MSKFHVIAHKADLRSRVRSAINIMLNRPTIFRVGIDHANVYIPETLYPESFYMANSFVQMVDSKGEVIPYEETVPLEDFEKHSCDCDTYTLKD